MKIGFGICGSIAAYRAPDTVKELVSLGHEGLAEISAASGDDLAAAALHEQSAAALANGPSVYQCSPVASVDQTVPSTKRLVIRIATRFRNPKARHQADSAPTKCIEGMPLR